MYSSAWGTSLKYIWLGLAKPALRPQLPSPPQAQIKLLNFQAKGVLNRTDIVSSVQAQMDCKDCHGACCKRIDRETFEVIRCQYLNEDDLCSVYESRPITCRLDESFMSEEFALQNCELAQASIKHSVTIDEFLACSPLQAD